MNFADARVARLATVDESGRPHLVPVTFALDGDVVYIAVDHKPKTTRNLKRLRNIDANPHVSLLVDHYADDWSQLWWIRADGTATILRDPETFAEPRRLLAAKYPQYQEFPPQGPIIRIDITHRASWHG